MGSSKKKDKKKKKTKSKDKSSSDKKNDLSNESLATTTEPPSSSHSEKSNTSLSSAVVKIEKSTGTTPSSPSQKIQLQPPSNRTQQVSQFTAWGQAFQAAASITPHDLGDDYVDPSTTALQELDRDGNVKEKWGSGNILGVSRIAVECMTKKKEHQVQEKGKKHGLEGLTDVQKETIDNMKHDDAKCELEQIKPAKKKSRKKYKKEKMKKGDNVKDEEVEGITTHDQDSTTDEIISDDNGNPELEGKMITHQGQPMMILIDNVKKVVYSGLDRSEDGNLIPIGHVHEDTIKIDITKDIPTKPIVTEQENANQEFPFDVDPDDHCESPLNAYQDIQPILDKLVELLGKKSKDKLKVYDPYYCNGSVIQHLNSLGYTKVYNKKQDCYQVWSQSDTIKEAAIEKSKKLKYPKYDAFVTNPPYSSDHVEKLILHLTKDDRTKGKPWCLLMPTFVHKKDYYKDKLASKQNAKNYLQPFYLVPKKRYVYLPPKDFREKKASDVHKKSSPFVSMWYIWGGTKENTDLLVQAYQDWERKNKDYRCDIARGKSALRDLRRRNK